MSPNEGFWISRYVKNKIVHISKMQAVNTKAKKEEKQNVSNSNFDGIKPLYESWFITARAQETSLKNNVSVKTPEISLRHSYPGGGADKEYLNIGSSLKRDEQSIFRGYHRGCQESKATHLSLVHLFETIYNTFYICFSYNEVRKDICKEMCKQVCQRSQTMGINAKGFFFFFSLSVQQYQIQQIILRGVEGAHLISVLLWQK